MSSIDHKTQIEIDRLSPSEIETVFQEIRNTVNITGYAKSELASFDRVIVAREEDTLAGICINLPISKDWEEIAVLLVLPKYRGKGIGKLLFQKSLEKIQNQKKSAYTTSRNPIVIKMMWENQFKPISLYKLPFPIQLFNLKFICSFYRIKEFFRKKMYSKKLPEFVYGVRE